MLWPGNSPDLSTIEKGWPWMKRVTTFKGAPRTRTDLETSWMSKWGTIPQDSIRGWIEGWSDTGIAPLFAECAARR